MKQQMIKKQKNMLRIFAEKCKYNPQKDIYQNKFKQLQNNKEKCLKLIKITK